MLRMLSIDKLLLIANVSLVLLVKKLLIVREVVLHDATLEHRKGIILHLLNVLILVLLKREILLKISLLLGNFHKILGIKLVLGEGI